MLSRLGGWTVAHRAQVLAVCLGVAIVAALVGRGLFHRLGYGVFLDPGTESAIGAERAQRELGTGDPDVVALYHLPAGVRADSPEVRAALDRLFDRLARDPRVARVVGATGPAASGFVSKDGRTTFAVISLNGDQRKKAQTVPSLRPALALDVPGATVQPQLGGLGPAGISLTGLAERSLRRGEAIALPIVGLLLLVIFGSVVAALLPLAIGGLSIVLALAILDGLSRLMAIDAFAVNVATILGLGVAIDYALFLVSRYREELAARPARSPDERRRAIVRALETAGRTVLFSGLTVATSLAGLLVFEQPLLRSVAVAGIAVTLLAATLALVVLPAGLALLGPWIERGRLPLRLRGAAATGTRPSRLWSRLATWVIRHRGVVCLAATAALVLLALPFRRLQPSRPDVRALPPDEEPRRVSETLEREIPEVALLPASILVEADGELTEGDRLARLWDYTERLRRVPNVARVESILSFANVKDRDGAEELAPILHQRRAQLEAETRGGVRPGLSAILHGRYALVRVVSTVPPDSAPGQAQVVALRAVPPPAGGRTFVFGQAATLHDFSRRLAARAPFMLLVVLGAVFAVLLAAFRSVVLPLKAMLLSALSLTASFGAAVFVFQDGRLERLLGYTSLGTTDATLPVVLFAVVFGLSMDYEVLILNRVREVWLRTHDNDAAVVEGLAQTGRLVSSAALLMIVVFSAFAAAPVVYVKALGLGMALAVALDATVVRMLLVPATMALLGRLNWWPGSLAPSRPRSPSPRRGQGIPYAG